MKFKYFKFENFKGIENQTLDLRKNTNDIFTLVGLNESGKTTVLEAINFFAYKPESLNALELDNYEVDDIHSLIPINKLDNFNGKIKIEACLEIDAEDIAEIKKEFKSHNIHLQYAGPEITFTQVYHFKNSQHQSKLNERTWTYDFKAKIGKSPKIKQLTNEYATKVNSLVKKNIPSILYFPNFLFEFPEKIYLDESVGNAKDKFYQTIIQDILDSLDNDLNINDHLIKKIESTDKQDRKSLTILVNKMQKKLSEVIFNKWNQIFKKQLSKTEIILVADIDSTGSYIEFNIKDDVDSYSLNQRSLGFRWFFVYILLTQFRAFRKKNKNALFLFDEPASNLHPSAQTELLKSFETLPAVIYTTHSHYLINPKWLENTFVIKNEAIDYENEANYHSRNTNIKIHKYRDFAVKYPNQSSYFQPILEILDYRPTNLELIPKSVITEGKNDFYTFGLIQNLKNVGSSKFNFIPGTSASNLENLISLFLGWGIKFIVLLDSDKEGIKQKERYLELFGISLEDRIITYQDIDESWKNFETENLFDQFDQDKIQTLKYSTGKKFDKKIFNRTIQELVAKNEKIDLTKGTSDNFKKVMQFLSAKFK
ncbi:AAA family ATPase [Flavobacterium sp. CYK-55]|uniref:ATP-dependent nuclease n=1 Tax=Flavobacterium sp. CYK-55 TaxID=2835529 RepID=UPI001BCC6EDE|nr:AAA family ATPase [Flavobacterium sp. CYK-55]MBS7788056.1 AAA family ATPase [Flavobacterium sp. CYK-55]